MEFLKLVRLKHWVKKLFVFLPLFFAGEITNLDLYLPLIMGFIAFGLVASSIYILNDIKDIENDRIHPKKQLRPLASGAIAVKTAVYIVPILLIAGLTLAYLVNIKFSFVLLVYFLMNLAYTFGLKKIAILDIIIVAIGFVLRIKAGSIIAFIPLSQWIIIMVFLLALFIAIAKRRDDLVIKAQSGTDVRSASTKYNLEYLNTALSLISGIIIVAYLMYTMSDTVIERMGTYRLFYTSLFVIAGILRYLQIALVENNTGSPTGLLYKDRFIQVVLILWGLSFYFLIYFKDVSIF